MAQRASPEFHSSVRGFIVNANRDYKTSVETDTKFIKAEKVIKTFQVGSLKSTYDRAMITGRKSLEVRNSHTFQSRQ